MVVQQSMNRPNIMSQFSVNINQTAENLASDIAINMIVIIEA